LQLDFRNAFNSAKRKALLQAIADHCPWFLPYALACYARAASIGFRQPAHTEPCE
jgi:hypothetical protein